MSQITDAARTDLHNKVRDVLGEREGDTLMEHLPPVGWADVATKSDIAHSNELMEERISQCATKADVERGFRRQAMWVGTLFVAQNAFFLYVAERLAN